MNRQALSPTHALLGLLLRGERHGYDLKRTIDQEFAPFWRIDFAQLYRSLARMARAGWVKARAAPGAGGPGRKVYALTARGRRVLEAWLAEPARAHDEFFVKLRLASEWGAPFAHLVETQRQAFEDERAQRAQAQRVAQEAGAAGRLVVAHAALRETEAALASLEVCAAVAASPQSAARLSATTQLTITGSDDPLLARLARSIHSTPSVVGSVGGLLALAKHEADVAGIHLFDEDTGDYNVPFVKHLVPEDPVVLVNLTIRENGLMLAPGNPRNIRGLRDLAAPGIRFINRQRGAGTRLLLYVKLRAARIDPHALHEWERAAGMHDAVAAAIAAGTADAGPGLRAVAAHWNLDFIPLGEERYDLVIPCAVFDSPRLRPLLDALHSAEFRRLGTTLKGYDLTRTGRVVARVK